MLLPDFPETKDLKAFVHLSGPTAQGRRLPFGVRPPLKVTNTISHQRAVNAASTSVGDQVVDAVGATLYSIDW